MSKDAGVVTHYDEFGMPRNNEGLIVIPPVIVTPDGEPKTYSMTEIPLGNMSGRSYPDPNFLQFASGVSSSLIQWWNDAGFDQRQSRPPKPPSPKTIRPATVNAKDGIHDGIYQVELKGKMHNVSVDKSGHGSINDPKLDTETKNHLISRAESLFRSLYIIDNVVAPVDTRYKSQALYTDSDQHIKSTQNKNEMSKILKKDAPFFKGISFNNTQLPIPLDLAIEYNKKRGKDYIPTGTKSNSVYISKQAINSIEKLITDSMNILFKEDKEIKTDSTISVNIAKLTDFPDNSVGKYDVSIANTLFASDFLKESITNAELINIAKNKGSISSKARVAVIADSAKNQININMVKSDGILISEQVKVYLAKYAKQSGVFAADLEKNNINFALYPTSTFDAAGLMVSAVSTNIERKPIIYPNNINFPEKPSKENITPPYPYQINDAIVVFPEGSGLQPIYVYTSYPKKRYLDEKDTREKQIKEFDDIKDAVKFTADFYKEVFNAYGEKAEKLAKEFEKLAKGKKIRNANDALKTYEKHKANINKKINAKDRQAIASALESVKKADLAKNYKRFSKGMGYVGTTIDVTDWFTELYKAVKTDNWRPFFVKTETLAAGWAATVVVALAFSVLLGNPVGILGYGLIMAVVGVLIDEKLIEKANQGWGI